jgi:hypothetical protein
MSELKPITDVRVPCRFCGKVIWAQSDNGEPTCADCDELEMASLRESHETELTLRPITEWAHPWSGE